jgi:hypothetical protein
MGIDSANRLDRAEQAIWADARVLEQRRFTHHFRTPDPAGVRAALAAYATEDGGYGYALEPDGRGPVSQPLHVEYALVVLAEIGALDAGICDYLSSVSRADGGLPAVHPSIRDYPRAPWWVVDDGERGSLIPTARIAGLLHRNKIRHPWLAAATEFCWSRIDALAGKEADTHPYEVDSAVAFLDHAPDRDRAVALAERLGELVLRNGMALVDPDHPERSTLSPGYAPGEWHLPHDYAPTPDSLARQWFSDAEFTRGLDFLTGEQDAAGGWPVRWANWSPGVFREWRGPATVKALLTLRTFGY